MSDLVEKRQEDLKKKRICRFCLSQEQNDLTNIYSRESRMKSAPLPLQVMACVSIEVFSNDSMPSFVCSECRLMFDYCYRFKQMCKKADTCLRHYPLTGVWSNAMEKPKIPKEILKKQTTPTNLNSLQLPRVINNENLTTLKIDLDDEGTGAILTMVDNTKQHTVEVDPESDPEAKVDIKPMINEKTALRPSPERVVPRPTLVKTVPRPTQVKSVTKKLLNKSAVRILNKEVQQALMDDYEPRMTRPVLKRDVDGKIAMVSEILDVNETVVPEAPENAKVIETNVFPCPHCERSFPLRQLLDIHLVNHNRERSFLCQNCDKSFFSKYDLQKHVLVHTGEKPFKCVICNKGFTRSTLLHRHEKTHTDIPKFICVFCEKPFISQDEMEKHTERHRKNRPFSCGICGKSFAFKQGLERHEIVHSRYQPFQCQYCDKSFSTPSKLARHLTAHAGVRPYPCKLCPKSYLLSHHLTRHMRSHKNGTGSYRCNDCDKTFSRRDDLIYHSAVHATQTLVCPLCKDVFENIETVTEHVKQHAEGEAFACEFCDLIYMTADRLQEHTDAEHAEDMVAYNEDERDNPPPKITNEATDVVVEENANRELEEVIEEFLLDEFADTGKQESVEKVSSIVIKEETNWQTQNDENEDLFNEKEAFKLDTSQAEDASTIVEEAGIDYMNMIEENEAADEPPSKVAKVNEFLKMIKLAPPPAATRRKAPTKPEAPPSTTLLNLNSSQPKENKNPIRKTGPLSRVKADKIAATPPVTKTRQPTIHAALQGLPKSVSVKKIGSIASTSKIEPKKPDVTSLTPFSKPSTTEPSLKKPAAKQASTTESGSGTKQSAQLSKQMPLRLRSGSSPNTKPQANPTTSTQGTEEAKKSPPKISLVPVKKTPGTTESPAGDKKIVEMMIGDKKVKVQRITMSKAQAAAMAREGRIQMKEGTMILKKDRSQAAPKGAKKSI